ncbi:MAG: serine--tRNA ligase [Nanohaloarchaea archaeon SW_4_43_9]|nr:MAG: serine--tRNA ligase [Nanohaloarchaea archaeon SW_4_43_9]
MLSINLFREEPERIKECEIKRGNDPEKVDKVVELDREWRNKLQKLESLQEERNTVGDEIADLKQSGEDASDKIERMQEVKERISELENEVDELKEKRDTVRYKVANLLHEDVPEGEGEENLLMSEKAAEVGGERAYYLTTELLRLNQALTNFALDFIKDRGFDLHQTPFMLEEDAISAAVDMEAFEDQLYRVNENGRYLIATAEHALATIKKDEVIDEELPLKLGGFSTNFRREAGKHGKQTRGLWRVHQFEKVEQFIFSKPENHLEHLESMTQNAEEIMQELGLPYRVVDICDGDIGDKTYKQYDIEVWRPPLGEYGEVGSYGSCVEYQTNKLGTKFFEDGERKIPYTIYATALANPRIITAIIENNQTENGIRIPEALRDYMGGQKYLELE